MQSKLFIATNDARQLRALGPLAAGVNLNEQAPREIPPFEEWSRNCGVGMCDGFALTTTDGGMDYSVMTNQVIPAGSPILYVPSEMVLTSVAAEQEFRAGLGDAERQLAEEGLRERVSLFRLFVKILAEYEKGDQSPYFPWLNSLPRQFYNGVSMTDDCFDCLLPYVSELSRKEREDYVVFTKVLQSIQFLDSATLLDKELIEWAYNVALTRSTLVGTRELRIAPMADYFNHGAETEAEIKFDNQGNCLVSATRDVPAGSPLRISLGEPKDPSPLFAKYGFLDETSPATYCKLLHLKEEMQKLRYEFKDLLFSTGGEISPAVYDVVLYSILGQNDPNVQEQFYQAVLSGNEEANNSFHQQYFSYTLDALKQHVDTTLRSLEELSRKAQSLDVRTHPRAPIILRHNEFVYNTFLAVQNNLNNMG